ACFFVQNYDSAGAQHRADFGHGIEIHGNVNFVSRQHGARRTAGNNSLQLLSAPYAAAYLFDHAPERKAHRQFIDSRPFNVAAQAKEASAAVLGRSQFGVPFRAVQDDMWDVCQRLDVIDNCGASVESHHSREGGLDTRVPSQSFERIQERCFLATLVGARTRVSVKVKIKARSQDVLSQPSACIGLFQGTINDVLQIAVFSPDVDIALVGPDGKAGDDHSLDQLVGIVFEQGPVLAGSRLALIRVADNVLGLGGLFGYEAPLHAGVEAGATTPSEAGVL